MTLQSRKDMVDYCRKPFGKVTNSLFQEEINTCVAVHTRYVMGACDCVRSIILLLPMMGCHSYLLRQQADCQGTQTLSNLTT